MRKVYPKTAHGLGSEKTDPIFSKNHYARSVAYPADIQAFLQQFDMHRIAGNVFECPSTKDFWKVNGNKIIKLVGAEVDNGESIPGTPEDKPQAFLANILDDLEF